MYVVERELNPFFFLFRLMCAKRRSTHPGSIQAKLKINFHVVSVVMAIKCRIRIYKHITRAFKQENKKLSL